eukprot:UN14177
MPNAINDKFNVGACELKCQRTPSYGKDGHIVNNNYSYTCEHRLDSNGVFTNANCGPGKCGTHQEKR